MSAAEVWSPDGVDMPSLPSEEAAWVRDHWVPSVGAFLAKLRPMRLSPGSEEEAAALNEFYELMAAVVSHVGAANWNAMLQAAMVRGWRSLVHLDSSAVETERKLAFQFIERAIQVLSEFAELFATHLSGIRPEDLVRAVAELSGTSWMKDLDAAHRSAVRCQLDVMVVLEALEGSLDDLTYWAKSALESSRRLAALKGSPEFLRQLRGDVVRLRARGVWSDWDESEIRAELAPWPQRATKK